MSHQKLVNASGYLHSVVTSEGMTKRANLLVKHLKPIKDEFNAIAFTGVSGALIAPIVAQRLRKDVIVVRKGEKCHSGHKVEGVQCNKYIIVDDFIDDGKTVENIREAIKSWSKTTELVGIALYNSDSAGYMGSKLASKYNLWVVHAGTFNPIYEQVKPKVKKNATA